MAPDGTLATAAEDGTVRLWDAATYEHVRTLTGHEGPARSLAFDGDATRLLTATDDAIRIFDLVSDGASTVLRGHTSYVYGVRFIDGGARIASGAWDGSIRYWDVRTGAPDGVVPTGAERMFELDVAAHAPLMVTGHERSVRVWNRDTGEPLRTIETETKVVEIDVTDDGALAVTRFMQRLHIWDPRTGVVLHDVPLEQRAQNGVAAIAPDGAFVVYSERGRLLAIDPRTGVVTRTLAVGAGKLRRAVFSHDGRWLATVGEGRAR